MYCGGKSGNLENKLLNKFPPAYPCEWDVTEGKPGRILDARGFILAWYLPEVLSETVQVNPG
jgi:hypothetical protein